MKTFDKRNTLFQMVLDLNLDPEGLNLREYQKLKGKKFIRI